MRWTRENVLLDSIVAFRHLPCRGGQAGLKFGLHIEVFKFAFNQFFFFFLINHMTLFFFETCD